MRRTLSLFLITAFILTACSTTTKPKAIEKNKTNWLKIDQETHVFGLPWFREDRRFRRLPEKVKTELIKRNPEAWAESLCPSGARVRFRTDSSMIAIRVLHGTDRIALRHMAPMATAGMDLYEGNPDQQSYRGTSIPKSGNDSYQYLYFENLPKKMRDWTLYLPTYSNLESLEIGIDSDSNLAEPTPYKRIKPIVFYGTSITQSCCSSRGSNGYVPLLSRLLNVDVINLGLSGAGKGEPLMADLLGVIDASAYVIDSVANMGSSENGKNLMELNYRNLIEAIRAKKPHTPIILMTKIRYADVRTPWGEQIEETDAAYQSLHAPLFQTFNSMKKNGDQNVFLFDAGKVIPHQPEHPSVDGIHLNDRGFWLLAKALSKTLIRALPQLNDR